MTPDPLCWHPTSTLATNTLAESGVESSSLLYILHPRFLEWSQTNRQDAQWEIAIKKVCVRELQSIKSHKSELKAYLSARPSSKVSESTRPCFKHQTERIPRLASEASLPYPIGWRSKKQEYWDKRFQTRLMIPWWLDLRLVYWKPIFFFTISHTHTLSLKWSLSL